MLPAERRLRLAELVRDTGVASTEALAEQLAVSGETIRRDLLVLEQQGLLSRVHGGATVRELPVVDREGSFDERITDGVDAKRAVARRAAAMVEDGTTLLLDVGTTALLVARALPRTLQATVVTPSLRIAAELAEHAGVDVMVSGGRLRAGDLAVSGPAALDFFRDTYFDLALLGSGGLHAEAGLTDYHLDEAAVRRRIIEHARRAWVLADRSKLDRVAPHRVTGLDDLAGVIVDAAPEGRLVAALDRAQVEVRVAETS